MRAKRCFFNAFSGLFSQFVSVALGVIIPRLVLVQLGSEANGLLSATQQALVYLDLLESGIGTAALQALYKPAAEQDRAAVSGIFNAIRREYAKVGIAYAVLVCGLSVLFPFFIKTELPFFTVLLTVLLGSMGQAVRFLFQAKYRVLLQAEGRGYVLINANLLLTVSISIGKIILLICGLSLIAVQLLCFLCGLLQTVLLTLYAKKQYSWLNRAVPPDTTATAQHRAVLVHQISGLIFQNTDVLLLSVVCGLKTTSVYSMYVMLFGMVGTAVSAINGSVSFALGQTYHTDRAHFLRLYRAFETYNMALTFALYLTADAFDSAVFEALHRRCDGYFVSRSRFAGIFLSARTCSQTDVQPRSASSNTPGIFKKRRTVPSSNPSSIFSYRFYLWCRLACTACSSGRLQRFYIARTI